MIDEINQITDGTSKQAKSSELNEHGISPKKRLFIKFFLIIKQTFDLL